ncbi:hypothetical protein DYB32_009498 [Aphanomyces invadans]|uniref:Uncharacterized protein n=1 Tax=Aphanomyces invadans TaxID=157072 RepID=A0A418AI77_9STRA|nr:hypothetical protein DYB32_009498 [Aphanomyces invadans]
MPQWVTSLDLDHKNTISIGNKLYCKPSLMVLLGYCTIRGRSGADVSSDMTNGKHASSHHSSTVEIILTRKESSMAATQMTGSRYPTPLAAHHSPPKAVKGDYIVIRIYDLVAAIVPWIRTWVYSPKVFGMIASNKFELTKSHIRLEKKSTYSYSRGDCCG